MPCHSDASDEHEKSVYSAFSRSNPRFVLLCCVALLLCCLTFAPVAPSLQAAEIPIVKLNPFNILNVKAEGEKELREVREVRTFQRSFKTSIYT